MTERLSSQLIHPWLCKKQYSVLHTAIVTLVDSTRKVSKHMEEKNSRTSEIGTLTMPCRQVENFSQIERIDAVGTVKSSYQSIADALRLQPVYKPVHLVEFEPAERYLRRHWLESLVLSFPITLFKIQW